MIEKIKFTQWVRKKLKDDPPVDCNFILIDPDFIKIRPKRKGIKLIREDILDRLKDRD